MQCNEHLLDLRLISIHSTLCEIIRTYNLKVNFGKGLWMSGCVWMQETRSGGVWQVRVNTWETRENVWKSVNVWRHIWGTWKCVCVCVCVVGDETGEGEGIRSTSEHMWSRGGREHAIRRERYTVEKRVRAYGCGREEGEGMRSRVWGHVLSRIEFTCDRKEVRACDWECDDVRSSRVWGHAVQRRVWAYDWECVGMRLSVWWHVVERVGECGREEGEGMWSRPGIVRSCGRVAGWGHAVVERRERDAVVERRTRACGREKGEDMRLRGDIHHQVLWGRTQQVTRTKHNQQTTLKKHKPTNNKPKKRQTTPRKNACNER